MQTRRRVPPITQEEIAEIHEYLATRRPAQTFKEQADQHWHAYAAQVIREHTTLTRSTGTRPFVTYTKVR